MWTRMHTSTALLSSTFSALSLGFTEPSGMGYISEFSEARLRGFLCSSTLVMMSIGTLYAYLVGALVVWRTALLICAILPVMSLFLVPWVIYIQVLLFASLESCIYKTGVTFFHRFQNLLFGSSAMVGRRKR